MSGECNYCGELHAEASCQADRSTIYENGFESGYASGHNDRNPHLAAKDATIADLREKLRVAEEALKAVAAHRTADENGDYVCWLGEGTFVQVAAALRAAGVAGEKKGG